jgi:hypothetical protein
LGAARNVGLGETVFPNLTVEANAAVGDAALVNNSTGDQNVALGFEAGSNLTTGRATSTSPTPARPARQGRSGSGPRGDQTKAFLQGVVGTALNANARLARAVYRSRTSVRVPLNAGRPPALISPLGEPGARRSGIPHGPYGPPGQESVS